MIRFHVVGIHIHISLLLFIHYNLHPHQVYVPYNSVFLINPYGAPLAQRASYLTLYSSLSGTVNHDYIVTKSLFIGSRCIPNGTHTNHCWANLAHASKHMCIKNCDIFYFICWHKELQPRYLINNHDYMLLFCICLFSGHSVAQYRVHGGKTVPIVKGKHDTVILMVAVWFFVVYYWRYMYATPNRRTWILLCITVRCCCMTRSTRSSSIPKNGLIYIQCR